MHKKHTPKSRDWEKDKYLFIEIKSNGNANANGQKPTKKQTAKVAWLYELITFLSKQIASIAFATVFQQDHLFASTERTTKSPSAQKPGHKKGRPSSDFDVKQFTELQIQPITIKADNVAVYIAAVVRLKWNWIKTDQNRKKKTNASRSW